MSSLLPVSEALTQLLASIDAPTPTEEIPVEDAVGRVLAEALTATRTQPPFPASAMDGYAVRATDLAIGKPLHLVGESAAGCRYPNPLGSGEAVRIFTGAPVPENADTILIQENARAQDKTVIPLETEARGRFIRRAGTDFTSGQQFFASGYRLRPKDMALAASLGPGTVKVRRRPRIAILATGDELVLPGNTTGPDQIIAANHISVAALTQKAGGETRFLGIARDDHAALASSISEARNWPADILVTMGGASVGDHDLVQDALGRAGMDLSFWRIAMRPGKPLMFGTLGAMRVLGLPGNPASSVVCAHLFLKPLIAALLGQPMIDATQTGLLAVDCAANDQRQDYLRARASIADNGVASLTPLPAQDSSLTHVLAEADSLVIRPPHAPAAKAGDACQFIWLD